MRNVFRAGQVPVLDPKLEEVLGDGSDSMEAVERRAVRLFPVETPVVWECDATSFTFAYVGKRAEELLGFASSAWLEPMFWAMQVVHEQDRDDAVTYCSLATKKMRDHMFEYRAVSADGRTLWFADYVKVVRGPDGKPERLRGAMFEITAEKTGSRATEPARRSPTAAELAVQPGAESPSL